MTINLSADSLISCTGRWKRILWNLLFTSRCDSRTELKFGRSFRNFSARTVPRPSWRMAPRNQGMVFSVDSKEELKILGPLRWRNDLMLYIPTLFFVCCRHWWVHASAFDVFAGMEDLVRSFHCLDSPSKYCYVVGRKRYNRVKGAMI